MRPTRRAADHLRGKNGPASPTAIRTIVARAGAALPNPADGAAARAWVEQLPPADRVRITIEVERHVASAVGISKAASWRAHLETEKLVEIRNRETASAPKQESA